jgi:hypothetical protein
MKNESSLLSKKPEEILKLINEGIIIAEENFMLETSRIYDIYKRRFEFLKSKDVEYYGHQDLITKLENLESEFVRVTFLEIDTNDLLFFTDESKKKYLGHIEF